MDRQDVNAFYSLFCLHNIINASLHPTEKAAHLLFAPWRVI